MHYTSYNIHSFIHSSSSMACPGSQRSPKPLLGPKRAMRHGEQCRSSMENSLIHGDLYRDYYNALNPCSHGCICGAWWQIGRVDDFRPERGSNPSLAATLGKSFTCSRL